MKESLLNSRQRIIQRQRSLPEIPKKNYFDEQKDKAKDKKDDYKPALQRSLSKLSIQSPKIMENVEQAYKSAFYRALQKPKVPRKSLTKEVCNETKQKNDCYSNSKLDYLNQSSDDQFQSEEQALNNEDESDDIKEYENEGIPNSAKQSLQNDRILNAFDTQKTFKITESIDFFKQQTSLQLQKTFSGITSNKSQQLLSIKSITKSSKKKRGIDSQKSLQKSLRNSNVTHRNPREGERKRKVTFFNTGCQNRKRSILDTYDISMNVIDSMKNYQNYYPKFNSENLCIQQEKTYKNLKFQTTLSHYRKLLRLYFIFQQTVKKVIFIQRNIKYEQEFMHEMKLERIEHYNAKQEQNGDNTFQETYKRSSTTEIKQNKQLPQIRFQLRNLLHLTREKNKNK